MSDTEEARTIDRDEDFERWEAYIEERAYRRFESRITQLQHELAYQRAVNESLMKRFLDIELLKPPAPIIITTDQKDENT